MAQEPEIRNHLPEEQQNNLDEPIDFDEENGIHEQKMIEYRFIKEEVNSYDIFKLAKGVLWIAVGLYVIFAFIRIFYTDPAGYDKSGIRDVWENSKIVLNSVISLVLGLYFGSKRDFKK